jgi:hypothetical protein
MSTLPVPIPLYDPIALPKRPQFKPWQKDPQEGLLTDTWQKFFQYQSDVVNTNPSRVAIVTLENQGATIGATAFPLLTVVGGLYRVTYYTRVTRAATVSSSLTVTVNFTDALAQTWNGAAMTGNTLTTWQTGTIMVYTDQGSPFTYATTYASVGATSMLYSLRMTVEQLPG